MTQKVENELMNLESLERSILDRGKELLGNDIFPLDILANAMLDRSLHLMFGFSALIRESNMEKMIIIVFLKEFLKKVKIVIITSSFRRFLYGKNKANYYQFIILLICISLILSCKKSPVEPPQFQSLKENIDALADKYVKVGATIGVINKQQKKEIFFYGTKSINTTEPPDANTVFDIGSITKTFTAILAADRYSTGNIQDDTVGHYLPDTVSMPAKNGIEITFLHLLSHTSGMPRTPHETGSAYPLPPGYDVENPYAAYTTQQVYNYLTYYCELLFTPGTWWEYSNTGYGLVGHILGLVDGTSYETVLTRDIFTVLEMNNSSLFLTDVQISNQALGHNSNKKNVPFYTANDIFQGAGMIKSSLNDMFKYLEANMGLNNTPLRNAMDLTYQKVMHQGSMGEQGMAWFILTLDDGQKIIYSAGGTNGHSSFIAFNQEKLTGAIVLLNFNMHDGTSIEMGKEIMKAIMKY